jgi:hypothetical protein
VQRSPASVLPEDPKEGDGWALWAAKPLDRGLRYYSWKWPHSAFRFELLRDTSRVVDQIGIGAAVTHRPPSRPGEFRPEPLTEPDVNLSIHPVRGLLDTPRCTIRCVTSGRVLSGDRLGSTAPPL